MLMLFYKSSWLVGQTCGPKPGSDRGSVDFCSHPHQDRRHCRCHHISHAKHNTRVHNNTIIGSLVTSVIPLASVFITHQRLIICASQFYYDNSIFHILSTCICLSTAGSWEMAALASDTFSFAENRCFIDCCEPKLCMQTNFPLGEALLRGKSAR